MTEYNAMRNYIKDNLARGDVEFFHFEENGYFEYADKNGWHKF